MKILLLSLCTALCMQLSLLSQAQSTPAAPLPAETIHEIINSITTRLDEGYPFPAIAQQYIQALKTKEAQKLYTNLTAPALAQQLSKDLRQIHKDVHLNVYYSPEYYNQLTRQTNNIETEEDRKHALDQLHKSNYGFDGVELDRTHSAAYIKISGGFYGDQEAFEMAANAMNMAAWSNYIIIDIRNNGGGTGIMGRFLSAYFYHPGEEKFYLNGFVKDRKQDIQEWTYPYVPGKRMPDSKLYILVNKNTASAAEGFAYALQKLGRATIVGDTTAGAGIAGYMVALKENLVAFFPVKMVVAPGTEQGWEGTGVIPDVPTGTEDAKKVAQELIQKDIDQKHK